MSGNPSIHELLKQYDRGAGGPESSAVWIAGILGGGLVGAAIALFVTARLAAVAIFSVGLALVVLSLILRNLHQNSFAVGQFLEAELRQGSSDAPPSASSFLVHLWSTGQAKPPSVDLVKLGLPPVVTSDISISQALEDLREEDRLGSRCSLPGYIGPGQARLDGSRVARALVSCR